VFGTDPDRMRQVANQIESGMVYFNRSGGSQADLPFGGSNAPGWAVSSAPWASEEFMNKKSIRL